MPQRKEWEPTGDVISNVNGFVVFFNEFTEGGNCVIFAVAVAFLFLYAFLDFGSVDQVLQIILERFWTDDTCWSVFSEDT